MRHPTDTPPAVTFDDAPPRTLLQSYLSDHMAGSAGGLALARRIAEEHTDEEVGGIVGRIAADLEAERDVLDRIVRHLGLRTSTTKEVTARVGELLGRTKLNGQLTGTSPLSLLVELEGLLLGVTGRRALWRTLRVVLSADALPADVDLDALEARADGHREVLEELRLEAARAALGDAVA
jgi:hypothetical protein